MRILHVNTERGWRGGERQVALLIEGQVQSGDNPHLFARADEPLARRIARDRRGDTDEPNGSFSGNPTVFPLDSVDLIAQHHVFHWNPLTAFALRARIKSQQYDILHLHTAHAHTLGLLASLGLNIPVIVHRRVDFPVATNAVSSLKYHSKSVHYIAISHAISRVLEAGGIAPERISVVHSAVPEPTRQPTETLERLRRELSIGMEGPLIGTVGALVDHKGHRHLLDAFPQVLQRFPTAQLILVGEGPLRQALQQQAQTHRISNRVHFLGERPDAHALQQLMDVYVVPSQQEGLNTAMLDAMWLEKPVVASRAGGIPEALAPGCGWLVPPRAPDALAAALTEVLTNPGLARERGMQARAHVAAHFTVKRMVAETRQVYRDVSLRARGVDRDAERSVERGADRGDTVPSVPPAPKS